MAEITNGAKRVPQQQAAKSADRKKDLWNHKPFADLYSYNQPIINLNGLSRKLFSNFIQQGMTKIDDMLTRFGFTGAGLADIGETAIPLTPLKDGHNEEESPKKVYFTVTEIIDPFHVSLNNDDAADVVETLTAYIDLGLFPLVSVPYSEADTYTAWEKFDNLHEAREIAGTIVGVYSYPSQENEPDAPAHIAAVIMWDPEYSYTMEECGHIGMLAHKNAILRLQDMIPTPEVWKSNDENVNHHLNFGVPVYEFQNFNQILYEINHVDGFISFLDAACVSGNLELPFIAKTLEMAGSSAKLASDIAAAALEVGPQPETTEHAPATSAAPTGNPQVPDVPVVDAKRTDDFGHKLRLYGDDSGDDTDEMDFEIG